MNRGVRPRWYRLVGFRPVPCDVKEVEWTDGRIVKQEHVGKYFVSTVFLHVDHAHGCGPPMLFETMIFLGDPIPGSGSEDLHQERCSTWEQAEAMHQRAVAIAKVMKGRDDG